MNSKERRNDDIESVNKSYTKEELIRQAQMLAKELGRSPMAADFNKDSRTASGMTPIRRFGSWVKFLLAAGLEIDDRHYTNEQLIAQVQMLAKELGETPTRKRFDQDSRTASSETIVRRFGSWGKILQAAGLKPIRRATYSREELIEQVLMLSRELNRTPRMREFDNDSRMASVKAVQRLFGSWNKFLTEAGLELNVKRDYTKEGLIAQVQMLARELRRTPTSIEFKIDPRTASDMTAIRCFGSWNNFLIVAGFQPNVCWKNA